MKSGFVAILGRPNVGKSSLLAAFVGEKVAIVSPKPQTTRSRLLGVAGGEDWQVVFVDTPGLMTPRNKLGEYMIKSANDAREGVDAVLCVVEGGFIGDKDREIMRSVCAMKCPRFLAVNKTDLVGPQQLMPKLATLDGFDFDQVVPVSAKTGEGVDTLMGLIRDAMPEGPRYFPDDMVTDQPERVMCGEIIREKALLHLGEEVPHGIGVEMQKITRVSDKLTEIHAAVYCERASHKSILIGKQGSMLRTIGSEARADIERLMGTKINLQLWVKVRENWRNRPDDLRTLGYHDEI